MIPDDGRGRRRPAASTPFLRLLLLLLPAASAALPRLRPAASPGAAAAAAPVPGTTRLRGAVYRDVDAPFDRDAALFGDVFPSPPADVGPVVVPCFASRSHSTPYLEVVRHLAARGYRVILLTDMQNAEWIKSLYGPPSPSPRAADAGGDAGAGDAGLVRLPGGPFELAVAPASTTDGAWSQLATSLEGTIEDANGARALARFITLFGVTQTRDLFPWVKNWMLATRPSLVVADLINEWLVDAAQIAGAKLVMTCSGLFPGLADAPWALLITSDYPAPSLERAPFADRFREAVLEPLDLAAALFPVARKLNAARAAVGLPPIVGDPALRVRGRLHLINSFVGLDVARPLPAHIRMIGPVRSDGNATLPPEWRAFLGGLGRGDGKSEGDKDDGHPRVVYLAFGQNCVLRPERLRGVLSALRLLLAEGSIDGAVWSLSMTPARYLELAGFSEPGAVPPQVKVVEFAPQKSLLHSPAVRVFVSHGGAESCGESIYSQTPVLMAPHFGDQASNAYRLRAAGMALVLRKEELADAEKVAEALRRLLTEASFRSGARRMRALALSKARLSAESAADEIEYIIQHDDSHLSSPGDRMSWVRANNVDIYAALLAVAAAALLAAGLAARAAVRWALTASGRGGGGDGACAGGACALPLAKKAD